MLKLATSSLIFDIISNFLCNVSLGDENELFKADTGPKSPKLLYFKHFYNPIMKGRKFAELGNQLMEKKKYRKALKFYKKAIKKKPSKELYYGLRGVCYLEIGDYNKAFSDFEMAVSKAKENGTEVHEFTSPQVLKILHNVVRRSSTTPNMQWDKKWRLLSNSQKIIFVQETLSKILTDDQFIRLGKKLFNAWKFKETLWCYTEAINRKPSESLYYGLRGFCYLKSADWDKAIADFEEGLHRDPYNKFCETHLAQALFESGRVKEEPPTSAIQDLAIADP